MIERLIDTSLKNRLLVFVLGALVVAGGGWAWSKLTVNAVPDVSPVLVQVFTITEGLAPVEVEKYVTYPLETAMTGLPDVSEIRSTSNFGLSVVSIYFEDGVDIYFARQLVAQRLNEASEHIPSGFGKPQMGPISTGMGLILYYYLEDTYDKYSLTKMRSIQDWIIKQQLSSVPGVTEVLGIGGYEKQYQVNVNPDALLGYNLTILDIIDRIKANNINVGAGFLEKGGEQFIVRSVGLASGAKDLKNIVVKVKDSQPVYLWQVADIKAGKAVRRGLQTLNGEKEVVAGMVVQLYGANTSKVISRVQNKLTQISSALPKGVKIVPYYQQSNLVNASVNTVVRALLEGVVLVVLVLLIFMGGARASVVVALSLPFSVLFAIIGMWYFGISANLMSLGGLAIAIGMMVDGAVVMVENVDRHLRLAKPDEKKINIIARACNEVARPIVFAVFIIVVVFLPLFTLQGVAGKMFRPLAFAVALAMLGSLVYAIVLAPVFSNFLMPAGKNTNTNHEPLLLGLLLKLYKPVVEFFVKRRWAAIVLGAVVLLGGIATVPRLGSEFVPQLQEGDLIVNMSFAPSISLTKSKELTMIVERQILKVDAVKKVVSRVGRGEIGAHADPINVVHALVVLAPRSKWRQLGYESQAQITAAVRSQISDLPGVQINMTQPIQLSVDELVSGVKAQLAVKLFGDDLQVLANKASKIATALRSLPGAADVQAAKINGAPQILIRPKREKFARYGMNLAAGQNVIHAAIGGASGGQVFEGTRRFDINVRYKKDVRDSLESIKNIMVQTPAGARVPLLELAEIKEVVGPRQIERENTKRFITVQANVVGQDVGSFVANAKQVLAKQVDLPVGYYLDWGGQFELQQTANKRLAVVVPITVVLIFLLLFASFGSIKNALLILLNIPLALVGGVIALWLSGQALSVPASIGFIALFGVAVLNGVVLVAYLNQLAKEGYSIEQASVQGACMRLRPVLMTAAVAILGLIPLLFATGVGSDVQRPLATVVVGGLVTSTALTLMVLPALYKWFALSA